MNFEYINLINIPNQDLMILSDPHLGKGYLDVNYFDKVKKSSVYKGIGVVFENKLIAFLTYYFTNKNHVFSITNDSSLGRILNDKIICLDTMVVNPDYRKKGIGRSLIENVVSNYKNEYGFLMYTWNQQGKINMLRIGEDFNFNKVGEYTEIWKDDCEKNRFICPAKNGEICLCSTVLLYKSKEK